MSPETRKLTLLMFGNVRKYSEYSELAGPALVRKYSEMVGNIRFRMCGKPWLMPRLTTVQQIFFALH